MSKHWSKTYVFTKTFQELQTAQIFKINLTLYSKKKKKCNDEVLGYLEHIFKQHLIPNWKSISTLYLQFLRKEVFLWCHKM